MTDFAAMLSTLRAEGDYKNTTVVGQAQVLGMTAAEFQKWEKSEQPPRPEWPGLVKRHYKMTDQEFELRLFAAQEDAIFKATDSQMNPLGYYVREVCDRCSIALRDVTEATFYGYAYINSMCFGMRPIEKGFIAKLEETFKVPAPPTLFNYIERKGAARVNLRGRTLKQRVILHFAPGYVAGTKDMKLKSMASFLQSIHAENTVDSEQTPLMLYYRKLLPKWKKATTHALLMLDMPRTRVEGVLSGEKILSYQECVESAEKLNISPLEQQALQYMNSISGPSLDIGDFVDDWTRLQEDVIHLILEKTPYMTDEQATEFLSMCWLPVNEAVPPSFRARTAERVPRFSAPKAPAIQFLFSLPGNEDMTPVELQEKLGIHYSTYLRRALGRINTSLDGYKDMCAAFNLDDVDQELLRHFCGLSRTMEHIYLVDCTFEQRMMADEMRNAISLLSEDDVNEIRQILGKYL